MTRKELIKELNRCRSDFNYWREHYVKIKEPVSKSDAPEPTETHKSCYVPARQLYQTWLISMKENG